MTQKEFNSLKRGDIVRHEGSGKSYVVETNINQFVVLVAVVLASNATEWEKV